MGSKIKKKARLIWSKIRKDFPATKDLSEKEHEEIVDLLTQEMKGKRKPPQKETDS